MEKMDMGMLNKDKIRQYVLSAVAGLFTTISVSAQELQAPIQLSHEQGIEMKAKFDKVNALCETLIQDAERHHAGKHVRDGDNSEFTYKDLTIKDSKELHNDHQGHNLIEHQRYIRKATVDFPYMIDRIEAPNVGNFYIVAAPGGVYKTDAKELGNPHPTFEAGNGGEAAFEANLDKMANILQAMKDEIDEGQTSAPVKQEANHVNRENAPQIEKYFQQIAHGSPSEKSAARSALLGMVVSGDVEIVKMIRGTATGYESIDNYMTSVDVVGKTVDVLNMEYTNGKISKIFVHENYETK